MLTTFSSSNNISNTEAAILSRRRRNSRNKSGSFSGFNKRRRERREALLTVMALGEDDDTEDKEEEEEDKEEETSKLSRAMATARQNEKLGFSPGYVKGGGGDGDGVSSSVSSLLSAEESAEAAFADLINTSSNDDRNEGEDDVKKLNLSELAKGSRMSEEAVRQKDTNIGGVLGDLINLGSILLQGGHIVKKKDGRV
jgi:hypothetical protein